MHTAPIIIVMTDPHDLDRVLERLQPKQVSEEARPIARVTPIRRAFTAPRAPAKPSKRGKAPKRIKTKRAATKRAAPAPRGSVSAKILAALQSGMQDVQSIADSTGAKAGTVRQALNGLIKRHEAERVGRGRFQAIANGAAAAA